MDPSRPPMPYDNLHQNSGQGDYPGASAGSEQDQPSYHYAGHNTEHFPYSGTTHHAYSDAAAGVGDLPDPAPSIARYPADVIYSAVNPSFLVPLVDGSTDSSQGGEFQARHQPNRQMAYGFEGLLGENTLPLGEMLPPPVPQRPSSQSRGGASSSSQSHGGASSSTSESAIPSQSASRFASETPVTPKRKAEEMVERPFVAFDPQAVAVVKKPRRKQVVARRDSSSSSSTRSNIAPSNLVPSSRDSMSDDVIIAQLSDDPVVRQGIYDLMSKFKEDAGRVCMMYTYFGGNMEELHDELQLRAAHFIVKYSKPKD